MQRTLIYLSSCAIGADGKTDPFMMQEQGWLLSHFEKVQIVSFYGIKTLTLHEHSTMSTSTPGFADVRAWLKALFTADLWREIGRLRRDGALHMVNVLKLMMFTQRGLKMHYWTEWLLRDSRMAQTTLYACWMSFDGYAAALSKRKHPKLRFVVRGHAFDVDTERNPMNPYLMKQVIAEQANGIYLISECAKAQFLQYMQGRVADDKLHVLAMGSAGMPVNKVKEPPLFTQGMLRVVSCAQLIEIKQVHLLVEALAGWTGVPLCWTHIGGGEGEAALRALAVEKLDGKENILYDLMGAMSGSKVQKFYDKHNFDVFINTSRKEGVPISIMEAMRHGIPVIAPSVGGIPELVTEEVGFLYAPKAGADGVREALEKLAGLSRAELTGMREAARTRWNEHYCSQTLLPKLFPEVAEK
ncbi:MAG: glycosyltransferase [Clostridia bacterium]